MLKSWRNRAGRGKGRAPLAAGAVVYIWVFEIFWVCANMFMVNTTRKQNIMGAPKRYDTDFFKRLFLTGEKTLRGISREFGISYAHLSKLSSDEKWGLAKKEYLASVTEAEQSAQIKKMDEQLVEMKETPPLKAEQHQKRSMQTGDKLGTLIQTGVQAVKSSDWKTLRIVTDTWKIWDEQMRKNHGIEDNKEQPLININVMAALPPKSELKRASTVDA